MKVKELIEELSKFPQDLEVWTEGCDCWGHTVTCSEEMDSENNKIVLIERG